MPSCAGLVVRLEVVLLHSEEVRKALRMHSKMVKGFLTTPNLLRHRYASDIKQC